MRFGPKFINIPIIMEPIDRDFAIVLEKKNGQMTFWMIFVKSILSVSDVFNTGLTVTPFRLFHPAQNND